MAEPSWNYPPTWSGSSSGSASGPGWPPPPPRRRRGSVIAVFVVLILTTVVGALAVFAVAIHVGRAATAKANRPVTIASGVAVSPAPSGAAADRGAIITVAGASQVLQSYWRKHESALVRADTAELGPLATGSAQIWERGAVSCGCYRVDTPRPLQSAAYFVPRQTRYPAYFVAEAQTAYRGVPWAELLVFTKHDAGGRWLVAEDSGFGPPAGVAPRLGAPMAGPGGYDRPVKTVITPLQRRRARAAAGQLASLWQKSKQNGAIASTTTFDLDRQTLGRLTRIAQYRQDKVQVNGLLGHYSFVADASDPLFEVAESNGDDLACQPVRETVVYTSDQPGGRVHQDQFRKNWGKLLRPGNYRSLTTQSYWQTCFLVHKQAGSRIEILNQDLGGSVPSS